MTEWQQKEYKRALEGQNLQVRKFAIENQVDIETSTTDHLRRWIYVLKEIKKKVQKYETSKIRSYFGVAK